MNRRVQHNDAQSEEGALDSLLTELRQDPDFVAEAMAVDLVEEATALMEAAGITRAQLADLMGVSRAYVTRMFNAPPNLTLRSIATLALAIGVKPQVKLDCEGTWGRDAATFTFGGMAPDWQNLVAGTDFYATGPSSVVWGQPPALLEAPEEGTAETAKAA